MSQDIKVIQVDPSSRKVSFRVSSLPISGIDLLIQVVILSLLNVPGQDVLDLNDGGGFPEMIGMNIDATDTTEVAAEISRRVRKSQTEIIAAQTGLNLLPQEKLKELFISSIKPGENIDEVLVTIRIINEAGQLTDVVV